MASTNKKERPYLRDDWFWSPESAKQLWTAVLEMAVNDAIDGPAEWENYCASAAAKVRADAREWLESNAVTVSSFRWICGVLNLEPNWMRELVRRAIAEGKN